MLRYWTLAVFRITCWSLVFGYILSRPIVFLMHFHG